MRPKKLSKITGFFIDDRQRVKNSENIILIVGYSALDPLYQLLMLGVIIITNKQHRSPFENVLYMLLKTKLKLKP